MKEFVKALKAHGLGFRYLQEKFPKLSNANIKEEEFLRPQIMQFMNG